MTLEDAGKIRNTQIAQELCLPPVKRELFLFDTGSRAAKLFYLDGSFRCTGRVQGHANAMYFHTSPLLHARRGRHQVRHLELLHQESKCQADESRRDRVVNAQGRD